MRNSIRLAAVSAVLAASFASSAQAADTATATASAEVLSTISVTKDLDMSFGQVAVNGDGTVVLAPAGGVPCSAQLVCPGSNQPPLFTVPGTADVGVTASVDQTSISLVHATDTTKTFTLDSFAVDFPGGNTLTGGDAVFNVGGTLNVTAANALAGVYSGTFDVTVEYQ